MALIKIKNKFTKVVSEIDSKLWNEKKESFGNSYIVLSTEEPKEVKELKKKSKVKETEEKQSNNEESNSIDS